LEFIKEALFHKPRDIVVDPEIDTRLDQIPNHLSETGYDACGLNPEWAKWSVSVVRCIYDKWFRVEEQGMESDLAPSGHAGDEVERGRCMTRQSAGRIVWFRSFEIGQWPPGYFDFKGRFAADIGTIQDQIDVLSLSDDELERLLKNLGHIVTIH
jgi:hypothetical protein